MITIASYHINISNVFSLKTSINTCNQHKQHTFDPFNKFNVSLHIKNLILEQ